MKRHSGFSLIEVMVGLGILSIGILALATLFDTSYRVLAIGRDDTQAAHIARNKMESLSAARPLREEVDQSDVDSESGMTRQWSIIPQATNPRMWVITVKVAPPGGAADRSVTLKSLVYY